MLEQGQTTMYDAPGVVRQLLHGSVFDDKISAVSSTAQSGITRDLLYFLCGHT